MTELNYELAVKVVSADFETGSLFWLKRPDELFPSRVAANSFNSRFAGKEALTSVSTGYRCGRILGRGYLAHRIIWLLATKEWPASQIDHINGVRTDNRLINLRAVCQVENSRNQKVRSTNTSGFRGVSWSKGTGKWAVNISDQGKQKFLGYFDEFEAAVDRRKAAEIGLGFHPNHGRAA